MDRKKIIYIIAGIIAILLITFGAFMFGKKQSGTGTAAETTPTPTIETSRMPTLDISASPSITPTKSVTTTPTKKPTATPSITPTPSPTPTPGVINIEASVSPTTSSSCTQKFTFTAKIYTNAAATVKYKWLRSDNASSAEQTLTYTEAGMQTVTTEWTLGQASGATYNGWERIEITSPGSALGNKAEYTLSCP